MRISHFTIFVLVSSFIMPACKLNAMENDNPNRPINRRTIRQLGNAVATAVELFLQNLYFGQNNARPIDQNDVQDIDDEVDQIFRESEKSDSLNLEDAHLWAKTTTTRRTRDPVAEDDGKQSALCFKMDSNQVGTTKKIRKGTTFCNEKDLKTPFHKKDDEDQDDNFGKHETCGTSCENLF